MIQEWDVRERNRMPFVISINSAVIAEKNAQQLLDAYREKEAEARELGNYEAQVRVYEESLREASERVKRLKQELAIFDRQIAERLQLPVCDDEEALHTVRAWLRGAQLIMESGTDEERATLKHLLGHKK